ncbi:MAG TPA: CBS domain-containing protein [Geminicoccaceae bacterium]|nr:CBS domain-containing protein [Geminicoccus sp.]HMU49128.1 CBS domain-containing protein [Geminicoccaceae bacterium]
MTERTVGQSLSRSEILRIGPEASVGEAARLMTEHACGCVLVMADDRLLGIFTERDALRQVLAADRPPSTPVSEVMVADPDTVDAATPVAEALRMMDEFHYWHLPVLKDGAVIGVVSLRDLPFGAAAGIAGELEQRHELAERMW